MSHQTEAAKDVIFALKIMHEVIYERRIHRVVIWLMFVRTIWSTSIHNTASYPNITISDSERYSWVSPHKKALCLYFDIILIFLLVLISGDPLIYIELIVYTCRVRVTIDKTKRWNFLTNGVNVNSKTGWRSIHRVYVHCSDWITLLLILFLEPSWVIHLIISEHIVT